MREFTDVARAVAWRNIRGMLARPLLSVMPFLIPLIFFATFAGGLSALGRAPGFDQEFPSGYTSFQFVFIWLQGSAFQGMFSGFLIARDYESGFARRLMLSAPNRRGILAGYMASAVARALLGAVIIFGVGLLAGMQVDGNPLEIAALVVLGLCLTVMAALWAAGVALRFRTVQAGPLMQMPIFIVIFLSPVFVPMALLTGWIHGAARVNPFSVFIEEGRNLIAGTDPQMTVLFALALGVIALITLWALRGLRSAERAG